MATRTQAPAIATDADLKAYIKDAFGIVIPDTQVCPNHSTPFRAFSDAFFARHGVTVWKASRGFGGKSYLLSLLGHCEAAKLGADVTILGGSGEQSSRVLEYLQQLSGDEYNTKRRTTYSSGGRVTALMASTRSARGPHPQRMRLDEVDEMDVSIFDAAMGQPMSSRSLAKQTVISSTHHYPDKTMTEILKRARANGWPVHEWCWLETSNPLDGWLSSEEVESKRGEVSAAMWSAEYDLQEPAPEDRAILPDKVAAMFSSRWGVFVGRLHELIEVEPPHPSGTYATGADWGRDKDYTIIVTLRTDVRPIRCVAWERRGREPYPAMIARLDQRVMRYGGTSAHDKTGLGNVVDDYITVDAEGVTMIGQVRDDLFSSYIVGIENGSIEYPMIEYAEGEHKYVTRNDLRGSGHPPDSVVAGAMAWYAKDLSIGGFGMRYI